MENRSYNSNDEKYKFTGKERDIESSYDYFGARYYMSRIGRWGSIDPMFEKYYDYNPYNYVLDNPLLYIDPNGKFKIDPDIKGTYSKLEYYLEYNIKDIYSNTKIMNALMSTSGLTKEEIKSDLKWGEGPVIKVKELGYTKEGKKILGEFSSDDPNVLTLDKSIVDNLENAFGYEESDIYTLLVGVTVLHEYVHYGAYENAIDFLAVGGIELGYLFEDRVYGMYITSYNSAVEYLNEYNKGNGKEYFKKVEDAVDEIIIEG